MGASDGRGAWTILTAPIPARWGDNARSPGTFHPEALSLGNVPDLGSGAGLSTMTWGRRHFLTAGAALVAGCASGAPGAPAPSTEVFARRGVAPNARTRIAKVMPPFAPRKLREMREQLVPLHERTGPPKPGEWRADHPESGQSFDEYLASRPTAPSAARRTLVVQPLGVVDETRGRILVLVGEALTAYFGLPTRVEAALDLGKPPREARRRVAQTSQLLSGWILRDVLEPRLPPDAAALLGFTTEDLWPGEGWNFVFGEASLAKRVGVWSLHRYGDPTIDPGAFRQTLRRAVKVALHESGHMFSLEHCTAFRCVQAGINSLEEEDASPLWPCPDCLAKIAWVTSTDPKARLGAMADFCRRADLPPEAHHFERDLAALG